MRGSPKLRKRPQPPQDDRRPQATAQEKRLFGLLLVAVCLVSAALLIKWFTPAMQETRRLPASQALQAKPETSSPAVVIAGAAYELDATAEDLRSEALEIARNLVQACPQSADAWQVLAQLQVSLGLAESSVQSWNCCIQRDPQRVPAYLALADTAWKKGDFAAAAERYRDVLAIIPDHPQASTWLEDVSRKKPQDLPDSIPADDDPEAARGPLVDTLVKAGYVYRDHNRSDKAEEVWCKAAHLDLTNPQSRVQLLRMYELQGRHRDALRIAEELIGIAPQNGNFWIAVGELNRRLGRKVQAREAVQRALAIDPGNPAYREVHELVLESD